MGESFTETMQFGAPPRLAEHSASVAYAVESLRHHRNASAASWQTERNTKRNRSRYYFEHGV